MTTNAPGELMIPLTITTNLDLDPWTDVDRAELEQLCPGGRAATIDRIGVLPNGTREGRACVELLIVLPDGRRLVAETTLRLFNIAARAVAATPIAQMEDL